MSAFICSDAHISTIACAVFPHNAAMAQELANNLKRVNVKSVNHRYGEKARATKCTMSDAQTITADDMAKLVACWDYQSGEDMHSMDYLAFSGMLFKFVRLSGGNSENGRFWSI